MGQDESARESEFNLSADSLRRNGRDRRRAGNVELIPVIPECQCCRARDVCALREFDHLPVRIDNRSRFNLAGSFRRKVEVDIGIGAFRGNNRP